MQIELPFRTPNTGDVVAVPMTTYRALLTVANAAWLEDQLHKLMWDSRVTTDQFVATCKHSQDVQLAKQAALKILQKELGNG